MARSYIRSRRGRKGGILVREAAVARGVPTNSLYSVPVVGSQETAGNAVVQTYSIGSGTDLVIGGKTIKLKESGSTKLALVRASSITVASKSPFLLKVLNSAGGYTTYEIQGQKPTKITLSRETSVLGNPALLRSYVNGNSNVTYVMTADQEDAVDIKMNLVVDSAYDD